MHKSSGTLDTRVENTKIQVHILRIEHVHLDTHNAEKIEIETFATKNIRD